MKSETLTQSVQPRSLSRLLLAIFAVIGLVFLLTMLLGLSYERAYAGRLFPGVVVLGMPMGGASYQQALSIATERADALLDHSFELTYSDGSSQRITPRELGLDLHPEAMVEDAYRRGREGTFFDRWSEVLMVRMSGAVFAFSPTFETDTFLNSLEDSLVAHEQPAVDARLALAENGELMIESSQPGSRIDRAALSSELENVFHHLVLPDRIFVPTEQVAPAVTEEALTPLMARATRVIGAPITLTGRDRSVTIPVATLATWVQVDSGEASLGLAWNREKITTYLAQTVARRINQPMQPRKINERDGGVLHDGQVGYRLDQEDAMTKILEELAAREAQSSLDTIRPVTLALSVTEIPIEERVTPPPFTPGLYEGKYVEVNLAEQALYQWEGETMVASYRVSTGSWSTPTPEGVLYVKNHIEYAYSRKYNLYMPWWMGLAKSPDGSGYEGYGIHELPEWKGGRKEGESHLGTPVSHGCIRLGVGPAESIYRWAEEGMPVYIHR